MMMKVTGITLNLTSIAAIIAMVVYNFLNISELDGARDLVSIIGSENGPTTIYLTAKVNRYFLIVPACFLIVFVFNIWYILKRK